ncbi:hypothetical protein RND71_026373 [Anisodus tanguticus]|uniref:Uncharacterized protein n=1 Tax=Anisodus tanguticus TaxID=243964 RepID=A0AAE1RKP6_9SOLA|nr:hypothetical protein RND71_026373 [Anisodus tanguticus]
MSNFSGSEEGSEESDTSSWIDPGSENQFTMNNPGEFWSDSGSERSKLSEYDGKNEGIRSENWSDSIRFSAGENSDGSVEEKQEGEKKIEGEQKRRRILCWKVPIELVKLYNMKKKTKPLELKVTLDDKVYNFVACIMFIGILLLASSTSRMYPVKYCTTAVLLCGDKG